MNVYVEGNGAREHCLRLLLARTATVVDTPEAAELIVVGPEAPLVAGYADEWRDQGKLVFGPGAKGAQLEGSKAFMKDFLARSGVPTARYGNFSDVGEALAFLRTLSGKYVVKTDGLAAGKGVLVTDSLEVAELDVREKLSGTSFGNAGRTVVIEEFLDGPEVSVFYAFDGKRGFAFPPAQDFKRIGDNDTGNNTGGMGAYSPVPLVSDELLRKIETDILEPTCAQLQRDGIDYRGVLYAGLILTSNGPKLLEYNVRFGDPDCQVSLLRYGGDLAELLASVAAGDVKTDTSVRSNAVVNIVLASAGYPESSRSGDVITGVEDAEALDDVFVFKAGVATKENGDLVTNGGRVLNVAAAAPTIAEARARAYEAVKLINFDGMQYRTDIALKAANSQ